MATVTFDIAKFREVYPQFTVEAIANAPLQWQADLALETIANLEVWGLLTAVQLERALYALVCHLCSLWQRGKEGQSGPLASASEGSVSASFAVPPVDDESYYLQTPCGQAYLAIVRPLAFGGRYYGHEEYHPW